MAFDDCGVGKRYWLCTMVVGLKTVGSRWWLYVCVWGPRAGGLNWWLGVGKVVRAKMAGGGARDGCRAGGFESRVGSIKWLADTDTGTMRR